MSRKAKVRSEETLSRSQIVRRRFFRNKLAVFGLFGIVFMFALAFLGPFLTPYSHDELDFSNMLMPPALYNQHYFGTTQIGGDVYAQTLHGLQKSLIIGLLVAFFSTGLAAIVGATAGYLAGRVDRGLMWIVDLLLVLPSFLILAVLSPFFKGKSWLMFVALLAIFSWMITARIVRSMVMSLRERDFIRAAKYMRVPAYKIIFRHLIPNIASILIIDATLNVGGAILAETGLSFLGFGIQPPDVSLGSLIAGGVTSAQTYPWLFAFAGGTLVLTVLSVSFVGDGLRDAFDPGSTRGANRK